MQISSRVRYLQKTKFKRFNSLVYSFDVETYDHNKRISLIGIYDGSLYRVFYDRISALKFMIESEYKRDIIFVAHNLHFDLLTLINGLEIQKEIYFIEKAGRVLFGAYRRKDSKGKQHQQISFYDTMSYANLSLDELGRIIGIPKLEHPLNLGKKPKDESEWNELITYNERDCKVCRDSFMFMVDSFQKIGANIKPTIASVSNSLYTNMFIGDSRYKVMPKDLLQFIFMSYKGGRTEAFHRGKISSGYKLYDVNSMYPYVMRENVYPNPNIYGVTYKDNDAKIQDYDGVSDVDIYAPPMYYPILPMTIDNKLKFTYGHLRGVYTHVELRYALSRGYKLMKVHKTLYFPETCRPFKEFVDTLYRLRQENKKTPFEYVIKILLNSHYGKYGEKYWNMKEIIHKDAVTMEHINNSVSSVDLGKEFLSLTVEKEPKKYCIPIWSSYVTAYARIKLHSLLEDNQAIYCDTDSIISKKDIVSSFDLGGLKKEYDISEGLIIRPKLYYFKADNVLKIKMKGVSHKIIEDSDGSERMMNESDMMAVISGKAIFYNKFMKIRESLRRGFYPNELVKCSKQLNINDDKRRWNDRFNPSVEEISNPLEA